MMIILQYKVTKLWLKGTQQQKQNIMKSQGNDAEPWLGHAGVDIVPDPAEELLKLHRVIPVCIQKQVKFGISGEV